MATEGAMKKKSSAHGTHAHAHTNLPQPTHQPLSFPFFLLSMRLFSCLLSFSLHQFIEAKRPLFSRVVAGSCMGTGKQNLLSVQTLSLSDL